jgi:hypothetical protein
MRTLGRFILIVTVLTFIGIVLLLERLRRENYLLRQQILTEQSLLPAPGSEIPQPPAAEEPSELLRLRNEVTALSQRSSELEDLLRQASLAATLRTNPLAIFQGPRGDSVEILDTWPSNVTVLRPGDRCYLLLRYHLNTASKALVRVRPFRGEEFVPLQTGNSNQHRVYGASYTQYSSDGKTLVARDFSGLPVINLDGAVAEWLLSECDQTIDRLQIDLLDYEGNAIASGNFLFALCWRKEF